MKIAIEERVQAHQVCDIGFEVKVMAIVDLLKSNYIRYILYIRYDRNASPYILHTTK